MLPRFISTSCMHVSAEHLPTGFPPDLPAPEPLPLADAKDAEALIDAVGEYTVRALYSKTWQLREAALMSIEKVLKGGGVQGHKGDLFKALSKALLRSVQDKVANVFQLTLQVMPHILHLCETACAPSDGHQTPLTSSLPAPDMGTSRHSLKLRNMHISWLLDCIAVSASFRALCYW